MKSISRNLLKAFGFAVIVALVSCQKEKGVSGVKSSDDKFAINYTPAKTSSELLGLRTQKSANLIRSLQNFDAVVTSNNTPLAKLSTAQLNEFRNSLSIKKGTGVVSLYYGILKTALSYEDFAVVMAMFGFDVKLGFWGLSDDPAINNKLMPANYRTASNESGSVGMDYECVETPMGRSCVKRKGYICDGC